MHQVSQASHPNTKNLEEITVRPAQRGDVQDVLSCLTQAFAPVQWQYTREAYRDTVLDADLLRQRMQNMHVLVAVSRQGTVGTVAASLTGVEGHLRGMAVLPEWQGSGLASKLLRSIEAWLSGHECRRITLDTTLPLTFAMKFYEKNGYRKSGRITDFFGMPLVEYEKELV